MIKVANTSVLIVLLFCSIFFAYEVLIKFMAQDTTYKRVIHEDDSINCPTITICFDPALKKTAIQHYNLSTSVYKSFVELEQNNSNSTMQQIFNNSSYWLGKDFILKVASYNYKELIELQEGSNNSVAISKYEHGLIRIERIYGYPAGLCYKGID